MTNGRNKGAAFERKIAKELHLLLGINFKRDLDQYRERDRGDLLPDNDAFPFLIECKHYASGGFQEAWWKQAYSAACATGKHPAVIYKINHKPIMARVQIRAAIECLTRKKWSAEDRHTMDINLEAFAYLAREGMSL